MSDLAVSPGTFAPAVLPSVSIPDTGLAQRNPDAMAPATETTLSPASERIIGLLAEERDGEEMARLNLALPEQAAQIAAGRDADGNALQGWRTELADHQVSNAHAEEVRRTEEIAGSESLSEDLAAAWGAQSMATRTGEVEAVPRDQVLADEIEDVVAVVRATEDALVAPARLADLLERMQAARPAVPGDGAVPAGEAFPLPVAVAPASTDRVLEETAVQESDSGGAPGGSDTGVTLPDPTRSRVPGGTAARDTEAGATEGGGPAVKAEVTMPLSPSAEDQARSASDLDKLFEQATNRTLANQARVEERRAEQDEVERASDRKAEAGRTQESAGAERFFEELAAARVVENLAAGAEDVNALRSSMADAAAEERSRSDGIAQVAAAVHTAEDEMVPPARLADLLGRLQAARPSAPADGAGPRPDPVSVELPEDAATRGAAGEQAERPAAEPSAREATARQDAALRMTQMFGIAVAGEGRAPSSRATQPDSRPETRGRVSAATPIQANSGHANASGQDDTPASGSGPGTPGAAMAPPRDAAGPMVPRALSGQMLNLSV